ncbi:uncharacterized protein LOC114278770 [Camellia sinensis]|uniref:uncharacterized protein LOC114278770 n=1 Tax=Camellia sinensis TaxID=4442 RepID=UPI00103597A1|nr:uncharacterized protein LOC114278770 [Camellia sinensis]
MGTLANLLTGQQELLLDLEKMDIELVLHGQDAVLTAMSVQSALIEEIKQWQLEDEFMKKICVEIETKPRPGFILENSVLKFKDRLCVANVLEIKRSIIEEAHMSRFSLHPDYHELMLDDNLIYEEKPIQILDRQVKQLRNKTIPMLKVKWEEL